MSCIDSLLSCCLPRRASNESGFNSKKHYFNCLFCKGEDCFYERTSSDIGLNMIKFSDNLFTSNRPTEALMREHSTVQKLVALGITDIVNIQTEGEHPNCGPQKLLPNGFTYSNESFENADITVHNRGWIDISDKRFFDYMFDLLHIILPLIQDRQQIISTNNQDKNRKVCL